MEREDDLGREWADLTVAERYRTSIGSSARESVLAAPVLTPLRRRIIATDAAMVTLAMGVGLLVSSRASTWAIDPVLAVYGTPVVITVLWLGLLALRGTYDQRFIGLGTEEARRVVSATLYTFALVAGVSYLFRADISRAYAFISLPLGLILIGVGRFAWRGWLYRQRARQHLMFRTIVVGAGAAADELIQRLGQDSYAGYHVVARCPPPDGGSDPNLEEWLARLDLLVAEVDGQAIALAPADTLTGNLLRQVAWHLEGQSVDLLIAPAILDTGLTRLSVRPAAGLPLLHLDAAALSRPQRFAKRTLDVVGSTVALVLLGPVLVACALWVRFTSRGPILFRQVRVGREGRPFTMLKFRTMAEGADSQRESLRVAHEQSGPMFKLADDPRITSPGRFLRRWSLDELPQLLNVLTGSMSLVGPRPHPLDDVNRYELDAYRRLALKPGMTGLWQVEGRSELPWQEALHLDLYYVETWSLPGDLVLLARTARAVVQGRGSM